MLVHIPENSKMMYTKKILNFILVIIVMLTLLFVICFFMNFGRFIQSEIFTAFTFNGNKDI